MRSLSRLSVAVVMVFAATAPGIAVAQYYDEGYDAPPRPYPYDGRSYDRPIPMRRQVGLNCDALQPGLTGPQPYSCPLPGPRPLGARCFCETPIAPLSGGDTVAGHVVP